MSRQLVVAASRPCGIEVVQIARVVPRNKVKVPKPVKREARGTTGQIVTAPWDKAVAVEPAEVVETETDVLKQHIKALEEDVQHFKYQAASVWGDYADARKRILKLMETVDSLESRLRAEKYARIAVETKLAELQERSE